MEFSVLFWNIWLDNQIAGLGNSKKILNELGSIVDAYNPDCIGLNEVLQATDKKSPFVIEYLQEHGYKYSHFAPVSPLNKQWLIGSAISSKYKLNAITEIELGNDKWAELRGYPDKTVKAIAAKVTLPKNKSVNIVVAHTLLLRLKTLVEHYKQTETLTDFLKDPEYSRDTIIGGDFNEPLSMPHSFKKLNKNWLHHQTGTFKDPTWRYNASDKTLLRFNLDRLFWTKEGSLELTKFELVDTKASDHKPLFATFTY